MESPADVLEQRIFGQDLSDMTDGTVGLDERTEKALKALRELTCVGRTQSSSRPGGHTVNFKVLSADMERCPSVHARVASVEQPGLEDDDDDDEVHQEDLQDQEDDLDEGSHADDLERRERSISITDMPSERWFAQGEGPSCSPMSAVSAYDDAHRPREHAGPATSSRHDASLARSVTRSTPQMPRKLRRLLIHVYNKHSKIHIQDTVCPHISFKALTIT
jgi:hypothetical protein